VLFFGPPLVLPLIGVSQGVGMVVGLVAGGVVALLCTIMPLLPLRALVYRIGEE
jgi:hypothetical protein